MSEPTTPHAAPLELARRVKPHIRSEGHNDTGIEGLTLLASHCRRQREPLVYEPGLVCVLQGQKIGYVDDRVIHYGAGHYLVQAMPIPFECETRPDGDAPLIGVSVRISPAMLADLAATMPEPRTPDEAGRDALPMAAVPLDAWMHGALARLIDCLDDPEAARVLGTTRLREVVFEALRGPQGHLLRRLLQDQGVYARIGHAIARLQRDYAEPVSIDALAASAHMSASSFHAHFKQVTRLSPLQYQKRIRLLRARDLLVRQQVNVAGAARAVGYQSASQFSREYKRYFSVAPAHDVRQLTTAAPASAAAASPQPV